MTSAGEPMILRVGPLLRRSGEQRDEALEVCLDDLVVLESRVPADAPIAFDAHLESLNEGIVVTGRLTTSWEGLCRRCLTSVSGTLRPNVSEIFVRKPVEGETRLLEGDHLDLEPVIRDAVLLELPMAPLCRPNCVGLCPECGTDGNIAACECSAREVDPRWAGLEQLNLDVGND
ncbi:MAG: YceD family protein [Acidimicrobiales bacterium]